MYLVRLELAGFKSFARPTTLEFKPPAGGRFSVTAIVGPNGSGKSNIADAIRWVLGEQSLKQIRGKKSEDVIFGGSEGKGKLSVASVAMTLDNRLHRAPVDYEELVVTRRVYRDGDGEYLVNGQPVRLFDLQVLLAQAQFGQGTYGIIGQGMIDRLLLQTPAERKSFFDEAAGIKEFQIKRHHAYLKLTRTEEHMAEAARLLAEVEPHLKHLRRQAKKLEERQEVECALRELEERYYATLLHNLDKELAAQNGALAAVDKEYGAAQQKLTAAQTDLAALAQTGSREKEFRGLTGEHARLLKEKAGRERELSALSGRLQMEYNEAGQGDAIWIARKLGELTAELGQRRAELEAAKVALESARTRRRDAERELKELERRQMEYETQRTNLEKNLLVARATETEIPSGVLRSVAAILKNKGQFGGAVFGSVADLGQVHETMRLALEVAAGAHLSSLVVADDRVAENCIRFLRENQLGVATFLPLGKIRPRPVPADMGEMLRARGVYGAAVELVRYESKFADVFSYIFGSTLVVADIAAARDIGIGRVRMVTVEGDMLETSGSMKGGYRQRTRVGLHFFAGSSAGSLPVAENTGAELAALMNSLRGLQPERHELQARLVTGQAEEQTWGKQIELLAARVEEATREVSGLEAENRLITADSAGFKKIMAELGTERETVNLAISELDKKIAAVAREMTELNERQEAERQRVFALQGEMQQYQSALSVVSGRKNEIQLSIMKLATRREDLEAEIFAALKEHAALLLEKVKNYLGDGERAAAKPEIEKLKYKLSLIGGIDGEVLQEYEQTRDRHDKLSRELSDLTLGAENIRLLIVELDTIMKTKHAAAMTRIKKEFSRYFSLLFDGGKAELAEVYGEETGSGAEMGETENGSLPVNPAKILSGEADEAQKPPGKRKRKTDILVGIEVTACPPGKKISNVAALSGGERTLTSLALVCAILHTNPPPFVLLDEVEAALDEANTLRFNRILRELSEQSQFIVITHNRVTMHAADVLYGVTMGADGVSQLLSVALSAE